MRRMTYDDILNSELQTATFSCSFLKGIDNNIPIIIDTLIQLIYFTGIKKDVNTPEGEYHSYCWHQYLQAPYSFRACFILYERGHYLEATFILRFLVEVLAKMKYLQKHKYLVNDIWVNRKVKITKQSIKKKKLTLRDIFEEIAPGYYDVNYGRLLSGFQHGGVGASIFRIDRKSPTEGQVKMGAIWDERGATFTINSFIPICYGYLNNFPRFFPTGFKNIDGELFKQYQESITWLKQAMDCHKKTYPRSANWYNKMEPLIN